MYIFSNLFDFVEIYLINLNSMADQQRQRERDVQLRGRRTRNVLCYVSSSSAKRRERKIENCRYCVRFIFNAREMEEHLTNYSDCLACYCRHLKKKTVDGVLIALYPCLMCDVNTNVKLFYHLRNNPQCLHGYLQKFEVESLE